MKPHLSLVAITCLLSPETAMALTLADLVGQWRGEGQYLVEGEPTQRLRCQMRGTLATRGVVIVGRCATAQAGQSFAWALIDRGDGQITAEDRSPVEQRDGTVPDRLEGRADADGLRFDTPDGGRFALQSVGEGLQLQLSGTEAGQPVRAEARLLPSR